MHPQNSLYIYVLVLFVIWMIKTSLEDTYLMLLAAGVSCRCNDNNRMNTILPIYSDCTIGERRKLYNATTAVIRLCTFSAPTRIENWRWTGGAEELHLRPVFADQ